MPPSAKKKVPSYRLHKPSGQAVVTLEGKDVYLGEHGTPESLERYQQAVSRWLCERRLRPDAPVFDGGRELTVNELILHYWPHAERYYRKNGEATSELGLIRLALRPLTRLYGDSPAPAFSPRCLCAVQRAMIDNGLARGVINQHVGRIRRMFKWATQQELVSPSVYHGLQAVEGLKRGRSDARETEPVQPVPEEHVDAVLRCVGPQVAAMIRLQLLTGMRPGEVTAMRGRDLDISGRVWIYEYHEHKTEHHGRRRKIYVGPQAQEVIKPFLKQELSAFLFSPAEAEAVRRAEQHRNRKTPSSCGNRPGTNRKRAPTKQPRDRYDKDSYRRAIQYACDHAFPPPEHLARLKVPGRKGTRWETASEWRKRLGPERWEELKAWRQQHRWHPNQLRHNAATYLRKQFGIDAARVVLGHSSAAVTEVYAELDFAKAEQIMRDVG